MCGGSNEPDYDPGNITDLAGMGLITATPGSMLESIFLFKFINRRRITARIEPLFQICLKKSIQKLSRLERERSMPHFCARQFQNLFLYLSASLSLSLSLCLC